MENIIEGIKFGTGFALVIALISVAYAVGFHQPSEVLPGTLQGNYTLDGDINVKSSMKVDGASNVPLYTSRDSNAGSLVYMVQESGSGGNLAFAFNNSVSDIKSFGQIAVEATDLGNGTEDGDFSFRLRENGSFTEKVKLTSDGSVGIGTTSPNATLDVNGSINLRRKWHGTFDGGWETVFEVGKEIGMYGGAEITCIGYENGNYNKAMKKWVVLWYQYDGGTKYGTKSRVYSRPVNNNHGEPKTRIADNDEFQIWNVAESSKGAWDCYMEKFDTHR